MIDLHNTDENVKLSFDFLENLQDDFQMAKSKFEKWVPFVLSVSTPEGVVEITESMQAYMTIFEVEKIYNGLCDLLNYMEDEKDQCFSHYSSENFFGIKCESIYEDECIDVELWFMIAKYPEGRIEGHRIGFGFVVSKDELRDFIKKCKERFEQVCLRVSLE